MEVNASLLCLCACMCVCVPHALSVWLGQSRIHISMNITGALCTNALHTGFSAGASTRDPKVGRRSFWVNKNLMHIIKCIAFQSSVSHDAS